MQRLNNTGKKSSHVREVPKVRYALNNINWDFTSKSVAYEGVRPFNCRKHHWFPATFVPEIPFTLIEILTHPHAKVYDPFSGIGTTYFQALSLNRIPLATEICEVAVQFMKSLLILFNPQLDFELIRSRVKEIIDKFDPDTDYVKDVEENSSVNVLVDKLRPWFHKETFNQLGFLFLQKHYCDDRPTKATIQISISAILKRVCSQDRGWGCIADNVKPKEDQIRKSRKNALSIFYKHVRSLLKDLSGHLLNVTSEYYGLYDDIATEETIFHADTRENGFISDESVDLVVTSPSYPNMTDYVKSQRLSYYLFGVPLSGKTDDLILEIGARNKRHRKDALELYLEDMEKTNEILSKKVKQGGYVCFVMPLFGRNDSKRKHIIEQVILDLQNHFVKEEEFIRVIPPVRRAHNIKWATLEQEKIFVFRK